MINDCKTDESAIEDMINVHNIHHSNIPDQRFHDGYLPGNCLGRSDTMMRQHAGDE